VRVQAWVTDPEVLPFVAAPVEIVWVSLLKVALMLWLLVTLLKV